MADIDEPKLTETAVAIKEVLKEQGKELPIPVEDLVKVLVTLKEEANDESSH